MDTILRALLIGLPVAGILTAALWLMARRDILRAMRDHPPPAGLSSAERYVRKPVQSTMGTALFVWFFIGTWLAGSTIGYVLLIVRQ